MKKKYYAIINWSPKSPAKMYLVSSKVALNMKGNKSFADPAVTMDEMDNVNSRVDLAIANRLNGPLAKVELDNASEAMDIMLRTQIEYVNNAAKGNQAALESSGFTISNGEKVPQVVPDVPATLKLTSSNGNVVMTTKKPKGAKSVCWIVYFGEVTAQVKVVNNNLVVPAGVSVTIITPGKAKQVLKGLTKGTNVTVQVLAQNTAGKSALSNPASIYVNEQ